MCRTRTRRRPAGPDVVGMLIADIGHPGTPTAAEERAYAARIAAGGADGRAARDEFVARNVPLAIRIAKAYHALASYSTSPFADLVAAGCEGLLRAVEGFDPAAGHRFSTYAGWWIRQAIQRHWAADRLVPVPAYVRESLASGRMPAHTHRKDPEKTASCLAAGRSALAAGVEYDPPDACPADRWIDESSGPEGPAIRADECRAVRGWLAELAGRDPQAADVLALRFGLDGGGERTMREVGGVLGHDRAWVRDRERRGLAALREIAGAREAAARDRDGRKVQKGA
jgi:RNA polymerase primary sigma factor